MRLVSASAEPLEISQCYGEENKNRKSLKSTEQNFQLRILYKEENKQFTTNFSKKTASSMPGDCEV